MLSKARHIIVGFIDFFHRPFARWIPTQTFRYLACGGSNTVLNIFLYYISYNFVLRQHDITIYHNLKMTAPIAAYVIAFSISFPIGFVLSRYIVFPESNLHGRVQLFRYAVITLTFIVMNYVLLKLFVDICHFYATPSYVLTVLIVSVLSYLSQRFYTFKVKADEQMEEMMHEDEDVYKFPDEIIP